MKHMKKVLGIVLILAMVLSLSACGGFETKMAKAAQKMGKAESFRMDLDMDLGMRLTVMGESIGIDAKVENLSDVLADPMKIAGSISLDMMDEEMEFLYFGEKTEEGLNVYLSADDGETWVRKEIEMATPELNKVERLGALAKVAATFKEQGTEQIRGSESTVYSGAILGSDIGTAMKLADSKGKLEELEDSTGLDLSGLDFSNLSDIPATVAIDNKSGMVSRCTMDMSAIMQDFMGVFMDIVMKEVAKQAGMEGVDLAALGMKMEIEKAAVTMELYDYNAFKTLDIPQAALEAKAA